MASSTPAKGLVPGSWLLCGYGLEYDSTGFLAPMLAEPEPYLLMGHDPGFYDTYFGIPYENRRPANEDWRPCPEGVGRW